MGPVILAHLAYCVRINDRCEGGGAYAEEAENEERPKKILRLTLGDHLKTGQ
jgi:hypothetical protein